MIKEINMKKLPKYKENLRIINGTDVYSYSTRVAQIKDEELHVYGWWSCLLYTSPSPRDQA